MKKNLLKTFYVKAAKCLLTLGLVLFIASECSYAQTSSFYYDKGEYWARNTTTPLFLEKAYGYWKQGEQAGEPLSARMLIFCKLTEQGTPYDINGAIKLMEKWYKKDDVICEYAAYFFLPKEYGYTPMEFYKAYTRTKPKFAEDYGLKPDIAKSLRYARESAKFYNEKTSKDLTSIYVCWIVEGICYKYGLAGCPVDLKQAAKNLARAEKRNGKTDYEPLYTLLDSAKSFQELYDVMKYACRDFDAEDFFRSKHHSYEWYERAPYTEFEKNRERLFKEYAALNKSEKAVKYNELSPELKDIFDNHFINSIWEKLKWKKDPRNENHWVSMYLYELDGDLLDSINKEINEYHNPNTIKTIKNQFKQKITQHLTDKQNEDILSDNDIDIVYFTKVVLAIDRFVDAGLIDKHPENFNSTKMSLLPNFKSELQYLKNKIVSTWERYERSRKEEKQYQSNPNGKDPTNSLSFLPKKDRTLYDLSKYFSVAADCFSALFPEDDGTAYYYNNYAEQAFDFCSALGFYEDNEGVKYKEPSSLNFKQHLAKYPKSYFKDYAQTQYEALLATEQDQAAFTEAYKLRTTSSKQEVQAVLAMPMSSRMSVLVKKMCKKSYIKEHEKYIESGQDRAFFNKTLELLR